MNVNNPDCHNELESRFIRKILQQLHLRGWEDAYFHVTDDASGEDSAIFFQGSQNCVSFAWDGSMQLVMANDVTSSDHFPSIMTINEVMELIDAHKTS